MPPVLVEYVKDACVKAFWTHNALRLFLRQNHISEQFLSSWPSTETKRHFIARLFDNLVSQRDNKGHAVILKIGQALSDMEYFPDLENYEDSTPKIAAAMEAIRRVKEQINAINRQQNDEKQSKINQKKHSEQLEKINRQQISFESLQERLDKLLQKLGTQDGGYAFETWFYDLAKFSEIQARPSYKDPNGRQIDGSITIDGTTFLIETKFGNDRETVTTIDSFIAKVTTKADNTMGIVVSMSGFNKGAINGASMPGTKILLVDGQHIYNFIMRQTMTLPELIRRIKRHASETGKAYLPPSEFSN